MTLGPWVYLNDKFVPSDTAQISPFDRGFLFAQSAYEVTAVFDGRLVDFDHHLTRLSKTLQGIEIIAPDMDLSRLHAELIERNNLREGLIYLQISAGNHGVRDFFGPEALTPTIFAFTTQKSLIGDIARDGITAISHADTRWARRDLKTTQLLSQSLAYRAARRAGAHTAILHEDGLITEAASANLWIVSAAGEILTRNLSAALLPGITRATVLNLLEKSGLTVSERAFTLDDLRAAREAFTTSTGVVIAPLIGLDEQPIADGRPGPIVREVQKLYYTYIGADISRLDWLKPADRDPISAI